jgi:hypothetical protein
MHAIGSKGSSFLVSLVVLSWLLGGSQAQAQTTHPRTPSSPARAPTTTSDGEWPPRTTSTAEEVK